MSCELILPQEIEGIGMFLHFWDGEYGITRFKNVHPNDLFEYDRGTKEYKKLKDVWFSKKEIDKIIEEWK